MTDAVFSLVQWSSVLIRECTGEVLYRHTHSKIDEVMKCIVS